MKVIVEIPSDSNSLAPLIVHGDLETSNFTISPDSMDVIHFRRAIGKNIVITVYDMQTGVPLYRGSLQQAGVSDFQLVDSVKIIGISVLVKPQGDFLRDKIYLLLPLGTIIPAGKLIQIYGPFMLSTVYRTLTEIHRETTVVEVAVAEEIIHPVDPIDITSPEERRYS